MFRFFMSSPNVCPVRLVLLWRPTGGPTQACRRCSATQPVDVNPVLVGIGSPSFSGGAFSIGGGDCLAGVTGVGPSGAGGPPAGLEGPRRLSR